MRNPQILDRATLDTETQTFQLAESGGDDDQPTLTVNREGEYLVIAASYGALEIRLRLRLNEVTRALHFLAAAQGMAVSRQIGSSQAHIGLGVLADGSLILRPTLVADASGQISIHFVVTDSARRELYAWLRV